MTERGALSPRYEKASSALAACWRGRNGRKTADRVILVSIRKLFVFPLMLFYTAVSYAVFRGKIRRTAATI